ncbi:hypothetical protein GIB67_015614 [Kingdonia uniflora]|uniref:Aminotransferase-like plant mobile domain-containing protein n=1 Tax=Kingdonia uniflora TaxID=39325 RepID=A0A7J7NUK9_9MAGN|nr:hypothetical protein GIB67_015614 [Kingdonia uniflora]
MTSDNDPTLSYYELNRVDILPDGWVHISAGSEEITNRDELQCRGSLNKVLKWYRWIAVYPTLKKLVDNMGFADFCSINTGNSDNRLIHALVERWWPSTHTFHFPCGELGFTPLDFIVLTGISFGRGRELPYDERYSKLEEEENMFPGITSSDIRIGYSLVKRTENIWSVGRDLVRPNVILPPTSSLASSSQVQDYGAQAADNPHDTGWFMDVAGPNDQYRRIPILVMQVPYPCLPTYSTDELWYQNQRLRYAAYEDSRQLTDSNTELRRELSRA